VLVGTSGDLSPFERDAILRLSLEAVAPRGSVLWGYYLDERLRNLCEVSVFLARLDGAPEGPSPMPPP
jgi:hypothetical protein